jgi:hypothetical protein
VKRLGVIECPTTGVDVFDKVRYTSKALLEPLSRELDVGVVAVEKYLQLFHMRFRTNNIIQLVRMNTLVVWECQRLFGKNAVLEVHPTQARSLFKLRKSADHNIKEVVHHHVSNFLPNAQWLQARNGKFSASNYDVCDAFIVGDYARRLIRPQAFGSACAHRLAADEYVFTFSCRLSFPVWVCITSMCSLLLSFVSSFISSHTSIY